METYTETNNNAQQRDMIKATYRAIIKMLHPDMDPGVERTPFQMNLLYKANNFYAERNYSALQKIYKELRGTTSSSRKATETRAERTSGTTQTAEKNATSLYEYLTSMGVEVIDKREKGGALWVVGTPEQIDKIVREGCRLFHAGGNYAMNGGRATGYRTAWFTKCHR